MRASVAGPLTPPITWRFRNTLAGSERFEKAATAQFYYTLVMPSVLLKLLEVAIMVSDYG